MKPNTKSLTFEELYNQIFNDGIITKQNKDKLYKSAKAIKGTSNNQLSRTLF